MTEETPQRHYFKVPFDEKGVFKRLYQGKWDKLNESWFTEDTASANRAEDLWNRKEI